MLLNGEDLSRYSSKIESVGLRKCPYYCYLIEKVSSTDVRTTNILHSLPHKMAETADMKKIRHCHPMYSLMRDFPPRLTAYQVSKMYVCCCSTRPWMTSVFPSFDTTAAVHLIQQPVQTGSTQYLLLKFP